jgi:peptidoglycan/xylan/chitin deacetylase (PgdA/CDA1 family)
MELIKARIGSQSRLRPVVAAATSLLLALAIAMGVPTSRASASSTIVSLTFDDGTAAQFDLAWQRALAPHGVPATFFVPTSKIGSAPGYMTWTELSQMAAGGAEIGGHTVDHVVISGSTLTYDQKVHEVCDDRQTLLQHGFNAVSFAYPEGSYDQTAEDIVRNCGYASGRAAGGVSASGSVYAETVPPLDAYATRTWTAPNATTSPIQLSDMEAVVGAAASHGGGWVQIVIHRVCSQTYDSANYTDCLGSWRPMELDTLNAFLDWMGAAGQSGGAPAGTVIQTVAQTLGAAPTSPAPSTQITCGGNLCSASWYNSPVTVALSASPGTGGSPVTATYYTTDGSTPTTASPTYTGPFQLSSTATVKFFSVDQAGDAESVKSQNLQIDVVAPTVAMTQPVDGSSFKRGAKINIAASASDGGSGVVKVDFYIDGSKVTTDTSAPYQYTWNSAKTKSGSHTIKAVASDGAGNSATSSTVTIRLN